MLTEEQAKKLSYVFSTSIIPTKIKHEEQFSKLHEQLQVREECMCQHCKNYNSYFPKEV